jgi:D-amino peptidase
MRLKFMGAFGAFTAAVVLTAGIRSSAILAAPDPGPTVSTGRPETTGAGTVKVLLMYDLEGVTATSAPRDVIFGGEGYPGVRESLTEDVNAAVRGLLRAGATDIVITDGHGSGNPEPDYLLDKLPKGARFDMRPEPYDPYASSLDGTYAAVVGVGMHSGSGRKGNLAHTFLGHTKWILAGVDLNESMLLAALAGRFDLPVILVTGDDVLKGEVASVMPTTRYVTVKHAVSVEKSEPRPRDVVSAEIEQTAEAALRGRRGIKPWKPVSPGASFENLFTYQFPEMASVAIFYPGAESVNNKTVRLRTRSLEEAYLSFRALAFFTAVVRQRMMMDLVRKVEGGPAAIAKAQALWPDRDHRNFDPTAPEVDRSGVAMGRHGWK